MTTMLVPGAFVTTGVAQGLGAGEGSANEAGAGVARTTGATAAGVEAGATGTSTCSAGAVCVASWSLVMSCSLFVVRASMLSMRWLRPGRSSSPVETPAAPNRVTAVAMRDWGRLGYRNSLERVMDGGLSLGGCLVRHHQGEVRADGCPDEQNQYVVLDRGQSGFELLQR